KLPHHDRIPSIQEILTSCTLSGLVLFLKVLTFVWYSKSLLKSLTTHAREHYPSCSFGVYPTENDSSVTILLVANKYSPNNFWCVFTARVLPELRHFKSLYGPLYHGFINALVY